MNNITSTANQRMIELNFYYKSKKQRRGKSPNGYSIDAENRFRINSAAENKMQLFQNTTDKTGTYIAINFYLQKAGKAELILLDSDKQGIITLLDKKLEAGNYSLITEIRNEELLYFSYDYMLVANGDCLVKKMQHVSKDQKQIN